MPAVRSGHILNQTVNATLQDLTEERTSLRRYLKYSAYKDSGVEWLGEIPEHWDRATLKRVGRFFGGGTPAKDNPDYWNGDIPWVSPKDMKADVVQDTADHITREGLAMSSTILVPQGAMLMVVRSGILAHSIPVALAGREVAINQDLKAFVSEDGLLTSYVARLVSAHQRALLTEWRKEGATVQSLEFDLVANTKLPIPSILEQHAIVTFLDREAARIDALIAKKERLIQLLSEKRAAMITTAVTKGLDPEAPMKDSGVEWLGEVPKHWRLPPLYSRYDVTLGKMLDSKRFTGENAGKYIRNVDVQWDRINVNNLPEMDFNQQDKLRYSLKLGDLLVCEGGEVGRSALWKGELETCFYQKALHRLRAISTQEVPRYLYYTMFAVANLGAFRAQGNPNTIDHLTAVQLKRYRFPTPPLAEQRNIVAFLDRKTIGIESLVQEVQKAIERLRELRTALISAAVTGKIDVSNEVA